MYWSDGWCRANCPAQSEVMNQLVIVRDRMLRRGDRTEVETGNEIAHSPKDFPTWKKMRLDSRGMS